MAYAWRSESPQRCVCMNELSFMATKNLLTSGRSKNLPFQYENCCRSENMWTWSTPWDILERSCTPSYTDIPILVELIQSVCDSPTFLIPNHNQQNSAPPMQIYLSPKILCNNPCHI